MAMVLTLCDTRPPYRRGEVGSRAGITGESVDGGGYGRHPTRTVSQPKPSAHPLAVVETPVEIIPTAPPIPWGRLAREGDAAWALFNTFRESAYPDGPGGRFVPRNLVQLAAAVGLSHDYIRNLSSSFQWYPRAGAYDRELDRAKVEADIGEAFRVRQRHLRLLAKSRLLVESELDKLLTRSTSEDLPVASVKELTTMLELIISKERLLMGEHTDHVLQEGEWKLEELELEELEELEKIRRKAKGAG